MSENSRGQNKNPEPDNKGRRTSGEDMTGANSDHQNASATGGGTTDMDNEPGNSARSGSRAGSGSEITTKRNVTGSDYDGQLSE
jgi:hypothetical protein